MVLPRGVESILGAIVVVADEDAGRVVEVRIARAEHGRWPSIDKHRHPGEKFRPVATDVCIGVAKFFGLAHGGSIAHIDSERPWADARKTKLIEALMSTMPLGFDREMNVIASGDSAEIYAHIYTERDVPVSSRDLVNVTFKIQKPDGTLDEETGDILEEDGKGFLRYLGTDQIGEYKVIATFTFDTDEVRSVRADFEVIDPLNPPDPTTEQIIGQAVWGMLEDAFDSEEGGPWLQDVTMATFKKEKMAEFIAEGLFDVNIQNPPTDSTVDNFIVNGAPQSDFPLLAHATLIAVIRHLIRSYVEQPDPTGAQIVYGNRRDYYQRWMQVLQLEETRYMRLLTLWKRQFLGLGGSRVLVGSKSGRMIAGAQRTRYIGRGYY